MLTRLIAVVLAAAALLVLAACSDGDAPPATEPPPTATVQPTTAATAAPAAPQPTAPASGERSTAPVGDVAALAEGNAAFAFDLHRALVAPGGEHAGDNLFHSPHSVSLALALAYAGASGETAAQMADTLNFALPDDRLHPAFDALLRTLSAGAGQGEGGGFRLNVANSLWGQEGYGFLQEYLDLLAGPYGAELQEADFAGDPDGARLRINDWAAEETQGKIRDLIPDGAIDGSTRLVLANGIYFNARWQSPFEEADTAPGTFFLPDGTEKDVPMMRQEALFGYSAGDGYRAVQLPYQGRETAMTVLVPDRGRFAELEESLDAALLSEVLDGLEDRPVRLGLPRFETESAFSLAEALAAMGMPDAFDAGRAEFAGVDGRSCLAGDADCLLVSDVLHKAFVSVDEEGTEAAAAAAVINLGAAPPAEDAVELVVDRPFILLVRHLETGAVLFLGRVVDP